MPLYAVILATLIVPSSIFDLEESIRRLVPILPLFIMFACYAYYKLIMYLKKYFSKNNIFVYYLIISVFFLSFIVPQLLDLNYYD